MAFGGIDWRRLMALSAGPAPPTTFRAPRWPIHILNPSQPPDVLGRQGHIVNFGRLPDLSFQPAGFAPTPGTIFSQDPGWSLTPQSYGGFSTLPAGIGGLPDLHPAIAGLTQALLG